MRCQHPQKPRLTFDCFSFGPPLIFLEYLFVKEMVVKILFKDCQTVIDRALGHTKGGGNVRNLVEIPVFAHENVKIAFALTGKPFFKNGAQLLFGKCLVNAFV